LINSKLYERTHKVYERCMHNESNYRLSKDMDNDKSLLKKVFQDNN